MDNQPQFTLRPMPQAELEAFNKDLQDLCDKHSAHMVARPSLTDTGAVTASLMAFKKIALIPQEDGTLIQENGSDKQDKNTTASA